MLSVALPDTFHRRRNTLCRTFSSTSYWWQQKLDQAWHRGCDHSVNHHVLLIDNSQRKEGRKEGIGKEEERKKEKKENISFDIVSKLFKEQNCEGAEEFYAKMNALQWRNKNNDLIDNQISYVLQSIEKLKHGTQAKQTNDSKGIDGNGYATQSKLTGAELRRLQRNNKETN